MLIVCKVFAVLVFYHSASFMHAAINMLIYRNLPSSERKTSGPITKAFHLGIAILATTLLPPSQITIQELALAILVYAGTAIWCFNKAVKHVKDQKTREANVFGGTGIAFMSLVFFFFGLCLV